MTFEWEGKSLEFEMETIKYTPELRIANTSQLPAGRGCRFLEVMDSHVAGELIAVQWRRTIPKTLPATRKVVEFPK